LCPAGVGIPQRAIYQSFRVPIQTYQALLLAESKGTDFRCQIRDRFACAKIHPTGSEHMPPSIRGSVKPVHR